ncbi:hypothetical protein T01_14899 [Trichinella spiralis]|uniref:Uncharacterized protein n=1 Tax=Trichinella spiralis TaxID=6334 RepID=A0A0V1AMQ1_TRISP|nr:hypothetical protein T01_14899 [Trichinella spiralis]
MIFSTQNFIIYSSTAQFAKRDSIDQLENSVSTNHGRRERKETTRVNFRRKAEQHNPHASIKLAVHFYLDLLLKLLHT